MKQRGMGHSLCGRMLHLIILIVTALVAGGTVQESHAQPAPLPYHNAPPQHIRFDRLPFDLLDQTFAVLQDHEGFLWAGAEATGLFKYDGYTPERFVHDPDNPWSLSDNRMPAVYEDRENVLWVGTEDGGLNRFDRETQTFTHFTMQNSDLPDNGAQGLRVTSRDGSGSAPTGASPEMNAIYRNLGHVSVQVSAVTRYVESKKSPDEEPKECSYYANPSCDL